MDKKRKAEETAKKETKKLKSNENGVVLKKFITFKFI